MLKMEEISKLKHNSNSIRNLKNCLLRKLDSKFDSILIRNQISVKMVNGKSVVTQDQFISEIAISLVSNVCISFVWLTSFWEQTQTKLMETFFTNQIAILETDWPSMETGDRNICDPEILCFQTHHVIF